MCVLNFPVAYWARVLATTLSVLTARMVRFRSDINWGCTDRTGILNCKRKWGNEIGVLQRPPFGSNIVSSQLVPVATLLGLTHYRQILMLFLGLCLKVLFTGTFGAFSGYHSQHLSWRRTVAAFKSQRRGLERWLSG